MCPAYFQKAFWGHCHKACKQEDNLKLSRGKYLRCTVTWVLASHKLGREMLMLKGLKSPICSEDWVQLHVLLHDELSSSLLSTFIFLLLYPLPGPLESHPLPGFAAHWLPHPEMEQKGQTGKSDDPGSAVSVLCVSWWDGVCVYASVCVCVGGVSRLKWYVNFNYLSIPLHCIHTHPSPCPSFSLPLSLKS